MTIDPIDQHVGKRIEAQRLALGLTLQATAARLGLTYQQIRKYENAENRVSASTLYRLSQILSVQPGFFFEGLGDASLIEPAHDEDQTLQAAQANLLERIKDDEVRDALRIFFTRMAKLELLKEA